MKKIIFGILPALFAVVALAQPPHSDRPQGQGQAAGQSQAMQQRMQEMHQQMARIQETDDPEERQRLMREHMENMHQSMMTMRQDMQRQAAPGQRQQCAEGDTGCQLEQLQAQQRMMGQRMGMMQMMMEQMMEQMRLQHEVGDLDDEE
jgi:hypothetical protein